MIVRSEENEPDALLEAMRAGRFYSTQGPELHDVALSGEALRVAASPVRCVALVGRGSRAETRFDARGLMRAELPVERFRGDWCRVVAIDAEGRQAWSNPTHLPA